jgi:hypothetical protein
MASDEDYMAFLNKANQDPSEGVTPASTQAQGKPVFRTRQEGVEVPAVLDRLAKHGGAFYTSDADEPFEAVALAWDEDGKGLPDEGGFSFFPPFVWLFDLGKERIVFDG